MSSAATGVFRFGPAVYDDTKLREQYAQFGVPPNLYPPWAGVSYLWQRGVKYWLDEMGWRVAHCGLDPAKVFFQEFDNGVMIGPVRSSTTGDGFGVIYTLVNERKAKKATVFSYGTVGPEITGCIVPWVSPGGSTSIN